MITLLVILLILSIVFLTTILVSIYIHENMKGTKIWNFVNKHIITDEDEYLNKK
jgi:hypothetical protein